MIDTQYLSTDNQTAIDAGADALKRGELVVFPTDTVYGIGAHAFQPHAIDALYHAKIRSRLKGIPILVSDAGQVERLTAAALTPPVERLLARFWPGALTIIVSRHPSLPANIAPNDKVAVRMPDCAPALALIAAAGGAVAATSANLSSEPPALSGDEALRLFNNRVAVVLDGGTAAGGVPSTIIDCSTEPFTVVREGPISAETIFATLTQETATERGSRPANL